MFFFIGAEIVSYTICYINIINILRDLKMMCKNTNQILILIHNYTLVTKKILDSGRY